MRVLAISDTHCMHEALKDQDMIKAHVLIIAGDVCGRGSLVELDVFITWLEQYADRYKHILFVPGNHDRYIESSPQLAIPMLEQRIPNLKVLIDEEIKIGKFHFYGSPWQPEFCNWAYNLPRNGEELRHKWNMIPDHTNVLITHGPPHGILDWCDGGNVGDETLRFKVESLMRRPNRPLKYHIFGHIHESAGSLGKVFHNVAICDGNYNPNGKPRLLKL